VAGLAAALRAHERAPHLEIVVLEAASRPGGNIATETVDGFRIESGADSFITEKPWALALCERLGLGERLIRTRPGERRTMVLYGGRLHALPDGFLLLAPTQLWTLAFSPLFTWAGKARMALDLIRPRRREAADESLASFVRRRLGEEALERVADALVGGIYTADPERLSLAATMPRFLEMERTHGSVIRGLRANAKPGDAQAAGARYGLFASHRDGMGALVADLAARLPAGALRLGAPVEALDFTGRSPDGAPWRVHCGGEALAADAVVLAVPAHRAAPLVRRADADLAAGLEAIRYASSAAVTLAFRREDAAGKLAGYGFVVPYAEGRDVIACTFSSRKYEHRAPVGYELLRAYVGGARRPDVMERSDDALVTGVRLELRDVLGLDAEPVLTRVRRHERAMPQYDVGHLDRVADLEAMARRLPGLHLAGAAYRGVGIPDCIHSGERAADAVVDALPAAFIARSG
jgi:oxygen-dependent protoporphyrinogen oxidase